MEEIYPQATKRIDELESELRKTGRWSEAPLPAEAFENMGAFGCNTMAFEQWLQFVLIPRIREIIKQKGNFPDKSQLAVYAVRYFDGDRDSSTLQDILYGIDQLAEHEAVSEKSEEGPLVQSQLPPTVSAGDTNIPAVLYSIAEVLPQFALTDLESQLQTFDTFLGFLSPAVRPAISNMLMKAAAETVDTDCKKRIEQAAYDVANGKQAAPDSEE